MIFVFGILVIYLIQYKTNQAYEKIIGYVKIHHKLPNGFPKNKVNEEIQEILHHYEHEQKKLFAEANPIKTDSKLNNKVLAQDNLKAINNEEFFQILKKQDLGKVTPSGVEKSENLNLSGYNLSAFNYKYFREFISADLRYCDFSNIKESALSFRGSSLSYAIFADALLPETNFVRSFLDYTNFYNTNLEYSSFYGSTGRKTHFEDANLKNTSFKESNFIDSNFQNTYLVNANFRDSRLLGNIFNNANLNNANFKNANLQGSSFVNANLENADFTNASLEGVDFSGANLKNAIFDNADVTQAKFASSKNLTFPQLNQVKFLLSAKSIPLRIVPRKRSWQERFKAPNDPNG